MENSLNFDKKIFYSKIVSVALPVMLQQLIIVAVGICDTIMVGKISENALAAVGAANQVFFVYIDCVFGFLSGAAVFSVQYWGIRDLKTLRKIMGIDYLMVMIWGIVATIVIYVWAPFWIGLFTEDAEVISLGTEYLRVVVFTYLIGALTFVISYNSRATAMLMWPTIINAFAVILNIFLNWCFIFGKLGFPELGCKGAAVATLISRIIEFAGTFIYIYTAKNHPLRAKLREMVFDRDLFKRVVKTATPVTINELFWVLSMTCTYAIIGKIGPVALAVIQICMTITDAFQAIYCGVGNGCNVVVGQELGKGNRGLAYQYAKKSLGIIWILNLITTTSLILARPLIVSIYSFEESTNSLIMSTLLVFAVSLTPKMLTYVLVCGILRPGGDTLWCAFADSGANWLIQVPLALLAVRVFEWSLPYCMAFIMISEVIKATFLYLRFFSKKWINVFTGR